MFETSTGYKQTGDIDPRCGLLLCMEYFWSSKPLFARNSVDALHTCDE